MKKSIALLLALLTAVLHLAACSEGGTLPETAGNAPAEAVPSASPEETPVEPEETVIPLGIPAEDNGGRDFHMLVPTEKAYEFVTESTGEVVNDVILARSQKTEELFGISFSVVILEPKKDSMEILE